MLSRDSDWIEWIRTLGCAECGGPAEPHHFKSDLHMSGVGLRAPDWLAIPLCRHHHDWIHDLLPGWKEAQRGWMLKTLILAERHGLLVRGDDSTASRNAEMPEKENES